MDAFLWLEKEQEFKYQKKGASKVRYFSIENSSSYGGAIGGDGSILLDYDNSVMLSSSYFTSYDGSDLEVANLAFLLRLPCAIWIFLKAYSNYSSHVEAVGIFLWDSRLFFIFFTREL